MALSAVQEDVPEIHSEMASNNSLQKNSTNLGTKNHGPAPCKVSTEKNSVCLPRVEEDDSEVDTRCDIKIRQPLSGAGQPFPAAKIPLHLDTQSSARVVKPRLTLSAFRGPAANITQSDPLRRLEDLYDIDRSGRTGVLGHGAFSTVRLALRKCDSTPVAVKSIAKHEALRSRRLRPGRHLEEWEILRRMEGHQFIIQLLDVFETDEEIQLVLEYCEGGELFNAIQRKRNRSYTMRRGQYTEQQAACIINQILRALCDLHAAGIVHRDLKPENILLVSDDENSLRVKLCDLGMARSLLQKHQDDERPQGDVSPVTPVITRTNAAIGGCYYIAPEMYDGSSYDTAVDMYSLGVTLYIVLCGFPPIFSGPDADEVMFPNSYWKDISEDAQDLVRRMLNPDATVRITASEALRDRWIWKHRLAIMQELSHTKTRSGFSQSKAQSMINLDVVRRRLSKKRKTANGKKRRLPSHGTLLLSPKRQRLGNNSNSASTALMALADLYRDVAQSPSAKVISSVVDHGPIDSSSFKRSPLPTLSV